MRRAVPRLGGGAVATGAAAGDGGIQGAVEAMTGRLVSIVVRRDFPLCGRFFIVGVSLLFLFFGKQPHDALPFGVIRSPLKQLAVMFYVLAPDQHQLPVGKLERVVVDVLTVKKVGRLATYIDVSRTVSPRRRCASWTSASAAVVSCAGS